MDDWFGELRERVRKAAGVESDGLSRAIRAAFQGDRQAPALERVVVAVTGLSAAAVAGALAATSLLGLAVAAVVLYLVLTRVFGFELKLDPATLFGGAWTGPRPEER